MNKCTLKFTGKRERTRQAIINAAISIIASKGLPGTSIDELMGHAGMARGTFYNYFQTREELLNTVLEEMREHIHLRVEQLIPQNIASEAVVACMMYGIIRYSLDHPCLGWVLIRLANDNDFFQLPNVDDPYFPRANAAIMNVTKRDIPFLTVHTYITGIVNRLLNHLLMQHIDLTHAEQMMVLVLRGIGVDETLIDKAIDTARDFADYIHQQYKNDSDLLCSP